MRKFHFLLALLLAAATITSAQTSDTPPNAQPGKCYAKCFIPDVYETTTEQVSIKTASVRTSVVPAEYETKMQYYLVQPATKRMIPVPAEYETITENVQVTGGQKYVAVKPADKRFIVEPATYETVPESYVIEPATARFEILQPLYETVTERIENKAATTKWVRKTADAGCLSANPEDCLVWCLVETPAEYQVLTRRVNRGCVGSGVPDDGCVKRIEIPAVLGTRTVKKELTPFRVREEHVPAEFKVVTTNGPVIRKFVNTPASYREEHVPAEYKATAIKSVKTPVSTRSEPIPPEYVTISKRRLLKAGGFQEWREILCDEKVSGYTINQVQTALNKAGYPVGTPDNKMGARTKEALAKFQKDKGLPTGNIDAATLKALGL